MIYFAKREGTCSSFSFRNRTNAQALRTRHENLARENEKLARQLNQRSQNVPQEKNSRRIVIVEDPTNREVRSKFFFEKCSTRTRS